MGVNDIWADGVEDGSNEAPDRRQAPRLSRYRELAMLDSIGGQQRFELSATRRYTDRVPESALLASQVYGRVGNSVAHVAHMR